MRAGSYGHFSGAASGFCPVRERAATGRGRDPGPLAQDHHRRRGDLYPLSTATGQLGQPRLCGPCCGLGAACGRQGARFWRAHHHGEDARRSVVPHRALPRCRRPTGHFPLGPGENRRVPAQLSSAGGRGVLHHVARPAPGDAGDRWRGAKGAAHAGTERSANLGLLAAERCPRLHRRRPGLAPGHRHLPGACHQCPSPAAAG